MSFETFAQQVYARFNALSKHELFVVGNDNRIPEQVYIEAFPEHSNPVFKTNTEHHCTCCFQFLRNAANVVAIVDGKVQTLWDGFTAPCTLRYGGCKDARMGAEPAERIAEAAPQQEIDPLTDFQEGQWWINELDTLASHPISARIYVTADLKRSVAVVHNLLRVVRDQAAPQPSPAPLSRDQIREVFMAHGFTIKEGQTDLKQYVYDAAYALLGTKPAPLSEREAFEAAWEKLHGKRPPCCGRKCLLSTRWKRQRTAKETTFMRLSRPHGSCGRPAQP